MLLFGGLGVRWVFPATNEWVFVPAVWLSLAIGMVYGARAALESLRAWRFDIDVLMVLAAALAAGMGHPEDGALLLFLFVLAGALEDRAMHRARRAVEALHRLMPTGALVLRGDEWRDTDPQALEPGDLVRVRTGELIPADAEVVAGVSSVDQAALTGESLPRSVAPGDQVYAGTINLENPLDVRVVRPVRQSSLQRILDLVIAAQQQREPLQRAIDRLSQPYAWGVLVASVGVGVVWWTGLGFAPGEALQVAVALLIVGSPCALVIATPTATLAAIGRAARAGVLFKGGQAIERLARMGAVCLDKTGTLTRGRPRLVEVHMLDASHSGCLPPSGTEADRLLVLAAAVEGGSTHPVAQAIVRHAAASALPVPMAEGLVDVPGRGLTGRVNGCETRLGTLEHCAGLMTPAMVRRAQELIEAARAQGTLPVVIAWRDSRGNAEGAGVLVLADEIRPGAGEMIRRLGELGIRPVRMLTGDNRAAAAQVAAALGLEAWDAELLPEDKVRILEQMRRSRRASPPLALGALTERGARRLATGVGAIGDGVNDAPLLAAADVSIAIGTIGSDAALESADIVLLNDDLTVIPWAVRLARRARAIVLFNLLLALSVIAGMALATVIGSLTGWIMPLPAAVIAHEGGTLLVVLNSLRLLLMSPPEGAPVGAAVRFRGAAMESSPASARPTPAGVA